MLCHNLAHSLATADLAGSFSLTLLHLFERFEATSAKLATTTGAEQLGYLRELSGIAAAMTHIPSGEPAGKVAKQKVAAWSFMDPAGQRLTLLPEVSAALTE